MAPYRALNVKQMYDSLFTCQNQRDLNQLFDAFEVMMMHGFISPYDWNRFHSKSCGVEYHDDVCNVVDIYTTP